ncbi:hypothetical protein MC885_014002 [Smutsia gigantea]|nr:hypothetical protein MC885_014002 [Smutsia gigantea]
MEEGRCETLGLRSHCLGASVSPSSDSLSMRMEVWHGRLEAPTGPNPWQVSWVLLMGKICLGFSV